MRHVLRIALALALLALSAPAAGAAAKKPHKPPKPLTPQQVATNRAKASYAALQKYLYLPQQKLYKGSPYSHVWPFSQAMAATVAMASLPRIGPSYAGDVADRIAGAQSYWDASKQPPGYDGNVAPPLGKGGVIGYDDNEWIGLELVRRYRRDRNPALLQRAQDTFALAVFGWDQDASHPCPGGVVFSQDPANVDRNTVTNAPGVELGLRLYQITHAPTYLDWSQRFYGWVRSCLLNPAGLYADHITFDGTIDTNIWAYNQGAMIGADVLFWKTTGDASYLRRAKRAAAASLSYFTTNRLRAQPPFFVSIFFDNLMLLNAVRPVQAYHDALQQYGDWAWDKRRNKASGVFSFGPDGGAVLQQAALVRIYATLAGSDLIG